MRSNSYDDQKSDSFQTRTSFVNLEKKQESPANESVKPVLLGLFLIFFSIIGVSRITVVGQAIDDVLIGFLFGWFKFFIYALLILISICLFLGLRFRTRKRFLLMSISTFVMTCWFITSIVIVVAKVVKSSNDSFNIDKYFSPDMMTKIFQAYINNWLANLFTNKSIYINWYSINGYYIMPFAGGGAIGALLSGVVSYTSIIGNLIISLLFTFVNFSWILTGDGFFFFKKPSKRKGGRIRILSLRKNKDLSPNTSQLKKEGKIIESFEVSEEFFNEPPGSDLVYPSRKDYDLTIQVPNYFYQPRDKKLDQTIDPDLIANARELQKQPFSQQQMFPNNDIYQKPIYNIGQNIFQKPSPSGASPFFENIDNSQIDSNRLNYNNERRFPTSLNKFSNLIPQEQNIPPVNPQQYQNSPQEVYIPPFSPPQQPVFSQTPQFLPRRKVQSDLDSYQMPSGPIVSRNEIEKITEVTPFSPTSKKNSMNEVNETPRQKTVLDILAEKTADISVQSMTADLGLGFHKNNEKVDKDETSTTQLEDFVKYKDYESDEQLTNSNYQKFSDIKSKYQFKDEKASHSQKNASDKVYSIATNYELPTTALLDQILIDQKDIDKANNFAKDQANAVNGVFTKFQVDAKVTRALTGPSVVKLEVSIGEKSSVKNIIKLESELKFALKTSNIIIEAPIEGKEAVGIEFASQSSIPVSFREAVEKIPAYKVNSKLAFPIGKNVSNEWITGKLEEMPHLLIAGSTGSGKSVMVNSIICSILMRVRPHEVKFLLIDPKKVELAYYDKIPHLLAPVISDMTLAGNALKKAVEEMERRYDLFNDNNVKHIEQYNKLVTERKRKLPYIVIVIDELADLMLSSGKKEVESAIQRLTQMARACGIHLIVATQRPSVDVITGVIKSNIPSRIAFAVASSVDSRTILDVTGGEALNGKGDMLFDIAGYSGVNRAQGCFIKDHEIQNIVDYVKSQAEPIYDDDFIGIASVSSSSLMGGKSASEKVASDPLLEEIIKYMIQKGEISTSDIQRRFAIGYNRAANFIQQFEDDGLVGPTGSGANQKRKVYIKE